MVSRVRNNKHLSLRSYTVCTFVEQMDDGTLRYDITLVDPRHNVDVEIRLDLFNGEVISAENHETREATAKVPAIVLTPVGMDELVEMRPSTKHNPLKSQ